MGVTRVGCVMIHIILLFTLASGSSEENKRTRNFIFGDGVVGPASRERDEEVAEQLWIKCRSDLMHGKEADENFNLFHLEERARGSSEVNSEVWSPANGRLHKAVNVLPPRTKQTLLGCLRTQNHLSRISGDARGSRNWYKKHLGSLFSWPKSSQHRNNGESLRLHKGNEVLQHIAVTPAFNPAAAPGPAVESPVYSPAPSSDPAPASYQAPDPQSPLERPTQPFFPPSSADSSPQPPTTGHSSVSPDLAPQLPSQNHSSQKAVVIAVTVTAVGTLIFAAMLFLCYRKYHKNNGGSGDGQKDDRPLLSSLSLCDLSAGSSKKSFASGNSMNKEKSGNQSFSTNTHKGRVPSVHSNLPVEADIYNSSVAEVPSSGTVANASISGPTSNIQVAIQSPPLKPPPGRAAPPPPAPPPPAPPPMPPAMKPGPPKGVFPPPRLPPQAPIGPKLTKPSAPKPNHPENAASNGEAPKTKLKPFFWDKVLANPDHSMVWDQLKSGSFQFNEEMIETLFGYNAAADKKNERNKASSSLDPSPQYIQIIDSKKAQNLAILLRALNVTSEEVRDALLEGNELPAEFLQTLLKMAPTVDEELKLRLFNGDLSQLGPAERFLKLLIDIPFAFKRMDALFLMVSLQEEASTVKDSLATLEVACKELKSSRLFLKLLEAVLKTGNRMNDGTYRGGAQAFKLDTLLKLSDVKGVDGKTTLLHFVVQEIIRSEGVRAARAAKENQSMSSVKSDELLEDCTNETEDIYRSRGLQAVSGLSSELQNVRTAAGLDANILAGTLGKLGQSLMRAKDFLCNEMTSVEDNGFHSTLKSFVEHAEIDITWMLKEEKRIMALVKSTADYFHGDAGKDEGLRLFVIVRDFLIILDKVCREVGEAQKKRTKMPRNKETLAVPSSPDSRQPSSPDIRQKLFPAIKELRVDDQSSDDESSSP
ncbi:formin-like protein 3 isoform X2 [Telopea speciosissima]|uniref:formin-like protein 3 isoform X2 n=1 Tax=Telopea speciosissima TaxID=54955 RepID=UPI001CC42118|nr:formin-like protein 3 isoform X2 [Telopea speciosissima]